MSTYDAMTDEQIDLAIAERVMGWAKPRITGQNRLAGTPDGQDNRETMGRPTESSEAALEIIEQMQELGWWVTICQTATDAWAVQFLGHGRERRKVEQLRLEER